MRIMCRCPSCHNEIPDGQKICPFCHHMQSALYPLKNENHATILENAILYKNQAVTYCPHCGEGILVGEKECPWCHQVLEKELFGVTDRISEESSAEVSPEGAARVAARNKANAFQMLRKNEKFHSVFKKNNCVLVFLPQELYDLLTAYSQKTGESYSVCICDILKDFLLA